MNVFVPKFVDGQDTRSFIVVGTIESQKLANGHNCRYSWNAANCVYWVSFYVAEKCTFYNEHIVPNVLYRERDPEIGRAGARGSGHVVNCNCMFCFTAYRLFLMYRIIVIEKRAGGSWYRLSATWYSTPLPPYTQCRRINFGWFALAVRPVLSYPTYP
jgi:hypothetical protein